MELLLLRGVNLGVNISLYVRFLSVNCMVNNSHINILKLPNVCIEN